MLRPPRNQVPGSYHLTTRGNDGRPLYLDDDDRLLFLRLIQATARLLEWRLDLWCLMTNHFHLLVETKREDLARGMHRLNSVYAHAFNDRHGTTGHLFERRYGSKLIESEGQIKNTALYVVYNPVMAGLCREPAHWPWTGGRMFATALRG